MDSRSLIGAIVALSAPDGRIFRFHVAALTPYAGETYAVLEHDAQDGQLLVTKIEMEDDQPVFVVVGEEDIITAVMEKQVAETIARAMADMPEEDECECGHHHDHDGCGCGHHHRPNPSYIKRQS